MDKKRNWRDAALGMQHLLAMFVGTITVPIIVGGALHFSAEQIALLIMADLLISGIATLLQGRTFAGIGANLAVVLGTTFVAVFPAIDIGNEYGFPVLMGSVIIAGIFVFLNAGIVGRLARFFPPVVIGTTVVIIGLSLFDVAMFNLAGGAGDNLNVIENLLCGLFTLAVILVIDRFGKGFIKRIAILGGILTGSVLTAILGKFSLMSVYKASWLAIALPGTFGWPQFELAPSITMCVVVLICQIESMGVFKIISEISGKEADNKLITCGYRAEGLSIILAGLFNSLPKTTFSQNVGIIQLTKITRTTVTIYTGIYLVVFSFLPKLAALIMSIPMCVLGGAMLAMFGMVASAGIRTYMKVDLNNSDNLLIIACSLALGLGMESAHTIIEACPQWLQIFVKNGVIVGTATAVALNLLFNGLKKGRG